MRTALVIAMAAWLAPAPAPALAAYDRPSARDDGHEDDPDDADGAFLGGPDPPWLLPFVLLFWLGLVVVTVALVAVGAVVAAWLLFQGAGALAALAILPGLLITVWVIVRRPSRSAAA